jgi:hypothetical protein
MSNRRPSLSVVVPWCDRSEIAATLKHNGPLLAAHGAELIVSNCGGDAEALERALSASSLPTGRTITIARRKFSKGLAINLGAAVARAPWLGVLDADILLGGDCLDDVRSALRPDAVVTVARVYEAARGERSLRSELTEVVFSVELVRTRGAHTRIETKRLSLIDGSRSGPGLVFLPRRAFVAVGGMNSQLSGWGWEDIDLLARLQLQLHMAREQVGAVMHVTHAGSGPQGGEARRGEATNLMECVANYAVGNLRGSYDADQAAWRRRVKVRELA